jgi:hypothetical protein
MIAVEMMNLQHVLCGKGQSTTFTFAALPFQELDHSQRFERVSLQALRPIKPIPIKRAFRANDFGVPSDFGFQLDFGSLKDFRSLAVWPADPPSKLRKSEKFGGAQDIECARPRKRSYNKESKIKRSLIIVGPISGLAIVRSKSEEGLL